MAHTDRMYGTEWVKENLEKGIVKSHVFAKHVQISKRMNQLLFWQRVLTKQTHAIKFVEKRVKYRYMSGFNIGGNGVTYHARSDRDNKIYTDLLFWKKKCCTDLDTFPSSFRDVLEELMFKEDPSIGIGYDNRVYYGSRTLYDLEESMNDNQPRLTADPVFTAADINVLVDLNINIVDWMDEVLTMMQSHECIARAHKKTIDNMRRVQTSIREILGIYVN